MRIPSGQCSRRIRRPPHAPQVASNVPRAGAHLARSSYMNMSDGAGLLDRSEGCVNGACLARYHPDRARGHATLTLNRYQLTCPPRSKQVEQCNLTNSGGYTSCSARERNKGNGGRGRGERVWLISPRKKDFVCIARTNTYECSKVTERREALGTFVSVVSAGGNFTYCVSRELTDRERVE